MSTQKTSKQAIPALKLRILYAEGDEEVLQQQAVIIENAGHEVTRAVGRKPVEDTLKRNRFDMVVLGPTLTKNDRHHLPYMVKKAHETTQVLVMHTDGEGHPAVDENLDTGCKIEEVVVKLTGMQGEEPAAK